MKGEDVRLMMKKTKIIFFIFSPCIRDAGPDVFFDLVRRDIFQSDHDRQIVAVVAGSQCSMGDSED